MRDAHTHNGTRAISSSLNQRPNRCQQIVPGSFILPLFAVLDARRRTAPRTGCAACESLAVPDSLGSIFSRGGTFDVLEKKVVLTPTESGPASPWHNLRKSLTGEGHLKVSLSHLCCSSYFDLESRRENAGHSSLSLYYLSGFLFLLEILAYGRWRFSGRLVQLAVASGTWQSTCLIPLTGHLLLAHLFPPVCHGARMCCECCANDY